MRNLENSLGSQMQLPPSMAYSDRVEIYDIVDRNSGMYATDIGDFGFTKTKIISPYGDAGIGIQGFDIHDTFQTDNNGNPYKDHTTFNNDFHIPSIDPCKSRPDRIIPKKS